MAADQPSSKVNVPSLSSATTALLANVSRSGFIIQNQGTNPLYILYGSGASTSVYHISLQAGTAASDGKGGILIQTAGAVYQGLITTAGTGITYTVTEL